MSRPPGIRDDVDRKLIALLETNARQSTMTLAKRLGMARSTVHERLRRLERDGVIRGYSVLLGRDPFSDYVQAVAMLTLAQRKQAEVVNRLRVLPEIRMCSTISADADLFLLLEAPLLEDIDALISEIVAIPGVDRCRSFVLLARKVDRQPRSDVRD